MSELSSILPLPARSLEWETRLATRRSAPAQALTAPAPSEPELDRILTLAARTPDHGKLFPWRFVILSPRFRLEAAASLRPLAARQPAPDKAAKVLVKLTAPPVTVMVVSSPVASDKIPAWEQELSAGAVCMNLEHAASALGYAASWITDWYSYDPDAASLFGVKDGERIAGFIHLGSMAEPALERPRPDMASKIQRLD
ncbi:nitroreductase [Brevundimonas sp. S30B]|uniref:nitroreductase family protein n=1 Tax=unclassified Brevundimonas TaxID=2622653 RepID=UPI001071EC57|nr:MULTISPECIES: nitroreductase [unclassified Brevundimonas]QBX38472.1 nitroreductase [Brevundimonas sp. MF30-B]TFW02181.1 nitroreductase [Brevundimonas sp. S30B]